MEVCNIYGVDCYVESKNMDTLANKEHRFHHSVHNHIHDTEERLTQKINEHDAHLTQVGIEINNNIDNAETSIRAAIENAKDEILANQSTMLSTITSMLN